MKPDKHRAAMLPPHIDKLPPEIFSQIFIVYPSSDDQRAFRRIVMLPGQVCQSWRSIALSTPRLWSVISVQMSPPPAPGLLKLALLWLERSSRTPLTIQISGYKGRNVLDDDSRLLPLLTALIASSRRWKRLTLDISLFRHDVFDKAKNNMPLLETLELECGSEVRIFKDQTLFQSAPNLRDVTLDVMWPKIVLPWSQLTKLVVIFWSTFPQRMNFFETIARCSSLEQYIGCVFGTTQPSVPGVFKHSRLHTLNVILADDSSATLDNLALPALSTLDVKDMHIYFPEPLTAHRLTSMLARSACALRNLTLFLEKALMTSDDLLNMLQLSSNSLEMLHLQGSSCIGSITDAVLLRLTQTPVNVTICPNLHTIRFRRNSYDPSFAFTYPVIVTMLESRFKVHELDRLSTTSLSIFLNRLRIMHYCEVYGCNPTA